MYIVQNKETMNKNMFTLYELFPDWTVEERSKIGRQVKASFHTLFKRSPKLTYENCDGTKKIKVLKYPCTVNDFNFRDYVEYKYKKK